MPEYLSPGVYVEEFDSGAVPMEGVGTSTAGFVGLAVKGPVGGVPQLVTGVADFRRTYGGYLSENEFGDFRYLAYAVEHFFINGGTRAYISRVTPPDAKAAQSQADSPLKMTAASVGAWGNELKAVITPANKAKTQILELLSATQIRVKSGAGFNTGDAIVLVDDEEKKYNRILKSQDGILDLLAEYVDSVVDTELSAKKILYSCEFGLDLYHGDVVENYSNLSLNVNIPDFITKKLSRSALARIVLDELAEDATPPFAVIAGADNAEAKSVTISFEGGSNGSMDAVTADVFMGEDNGPGKRTGIQAFIDNSNVSIMAVPGITDPNIQLMLGFKSVKGIKLAVAFEPLQVGGMNDGPVMLPVPVKDGGKITFERGKYKSGAQLPRPGTALDELAVILYDEDSQYRAEYVLESPIVESIELGSLDAMTSEVAIETLTVAYRSITEKINYNG